jgi:hypothetical protein
MAQAVQMDQGRTYSSSRKAAEAGAAEPQREDKDPGMQQDFKEVLQNAGDEAAATAREWPVSATFAAAALGLAAASLIGVGEVAVAGVAGYLAYRWLRRDRGEAGRST